MGIGRRTGYAETRHFDTLQAGLAGMLEQQQTLRFGSYPPAQQDLPKFKRIVLTDNNAPGEAFYLLEIPPRPGNGLGLPPGMYLGYADKSMEKLQEKIQLDISAFKSFAPQTNFLQIAGYDYKDGLNIRIDPQLEKLHDRLTDFGQHQRYQLQLNKINPQTDSIIKYQYPFAELKDAFAELLQLDIAAFAPKATVSQPGAELLTYAAIHDLNGDKMLGMVHADHRAPGSWIDPKGVYLEFNISPVVFEIRSGVKLGQLTEGDQQQPYMMLAGYNHDLSKLSVLSKYNELKEAISSPQNEQQTGYSLHMVYNSKRQTSELSTDKPTPVFNFDDLHSAMDRFFGIDKSQFEKNSLRHAIVTDNNAKREIATKTIYYPNKILDGVLKIDINPAAMNMEVISSIAPRIALLKESNLQNILSCYQHDRGAVLDRKQYQTAKEVAMPSREKRAI
ncbi:hypothetical protein PV783_13735 [Chitinophaga sp. CC14]|uniref:hypothetical protein n=1 Tax=Chitinophaga sp. CC14 TaxID=3029199 RepID=UPI003B7D940F